MSPPPADRPGSRPAPAVADATQYGQSPPAAPPPDADATQHHSAPVPTPDATHFGPAPSADRDSTLPAPTPAPSGRPGSLPGSPSGPGRGRRVGDYELLQELGRGGMGVVYKARDVRLNRLVALKMIRAGVHASSGDADRFLAEARAVARLDHPYIVPLYEIGEADGLPYFAMAFVTGGSLQQRLAEGPLPPREAVLLLQQVAEGVQHAHERGIVHRDLKPHNILLHREEGASTAGGTAASLNAGSVPRGASGLSTGSVPRAATGLSVAKISDFGLARVLDQEGMTATGEVLGTPSYMPPEQASGRTREIGPLADVYALGAVLYALLTGRPPFQAPTPTETLRLVIDQEPVAPRRLNAGVPLDLQTICLKCLEKDPDRRYASAAALAEDLGHFVTGEPITARPAGMGERAAKWVRRRPVVAALLAAVVLLTVAGLAGITWAYGQAVRERDRARLAEVQARLAEAQAQAERDAAVEANRRRVQAQVEQLGTAAPQAVPAILAALAEDREAVLPRLRETWADERGGRLRRMRAGLALLPAEPDAVKGPLAAWLLEADDPREMLLIRDALLPFKKELAADLWRRVDDRQTPVAHSFQALVALAAFDSDNERWQKAAPLAVERLLEANPLYLGLWTEALRPARGRLLGTLADVFRGRRLAEKRQVATSILSDYAADQPAVLADLLADADPRQYAVLRPVMQRHGERAVALLKQELARTLAADWQDAPLDPAWLAPDPSLVRQLEAAHGLIAERFALCQTMPLDQFLATAEGLRLSGYRPTRFRPYTVGKAVSVAAVWTRDGRDWQLSPGVSAEEIRKRDSQWHAKGYLPVDVAGYLAPAEGGAPAERYVALWTKPASKSEEARLYVGVPAARHKTDGWEPLQKAQLIGRSCQAVLGQGGERLYSGVYWKTEPTLTYQSRFADDEPAYEDLPTSAKLQTDVCLMKAQPPADPQDGYRQQLAQAEKDLQAKPGDLNALFRRAQAWYRLGQHQRALADLSALIDKNTNPKFWGGHRYRALVYARLGHPAFALEDLAEFSKRCDIAKTRAYTEALVLAACGQHMEGVRRLEEAIQEYPKDSQFLYDAACASAVAAQFARTRAIGEAVSTLSPAYAFGQSVLPLWRSAEQVVQAKDATERTVALLEQAVVQGYTNYRHMQTDEDLQALHRHPGFAVLLSKGHLERQYAAVWHDSAVYESVEVHGLDPARQRERCRELLAQGYRPAALSVADLQEGEPLTTASVWHRPFVLAAGRDVLASRQANAAMALLQLGQPEPVWPLLRHSPDPSRRSYLIHRLGPLQAEPRMILKRLEEETDVSARRALVLSLGELTAEQLPADLRQPLTARLLQWYRSDPDPGLHAAIDWLLRHGKEGDTPRPLDWQQATALEQTDHELTGKPPGTRRWTINGQGQTLVHFNPVEFLMGSPASEPDRRSNEGQHHRRIERRFAVASRPVTVRQWQAFRKAHPEVRHFYTQKYSPDLDCPIITITWYDAAQYCRWLSEQENVAPDQMCYPTVADMEKCKDGRTPLKLPADYLKRTGYRLPTEAEWEYACRAGALTSRFHGDPEALLKQHAWYLHNAGDRTWPVGEKKPNDFGLFDMHGNVWQWCQESFASYAQSKSSISIYDKEDISDVIDAKSRVLRGGSFGNHPSAVRCAYRFALRPSSRGVTVGLRVARTYR